MISFEKHILKAMPKVHKEYLEQWSKEIHKDIYFELDSIEIVYEDDCSWAEITIRWGREGEISFHNKITFVVYPRHLKYLVGYILGVIEYREQIDLIG